MKNKEGIEELFCPTSKQRDIEENPLRANKNIMNSNTEENLKEALDFIQNRIEEELPYGEIIYSEDVYHEDLDEIVRFILISRGEKEYYMSFGFDGYIYSYSKTIPRMMLLDIHNAICYSIRTELISQIYKEEQDE